MARIGGRDDERRGLLAPSGCRCGFHLTIPFVIAVDPPVKLLISPLAPEGPPHMTEGERGKVVQREFEFVRRGLRWLCRELSTLNSAAQLISADYEGRTRCIRRPNGDLSTLNPSPHSRLSTLHPTTYFL